VNIGRGSTDNLRKLEKLEFLEGKILLKRSKKRCRCTIRYTMSDTANIALLVKHHLSSLKIFIGDYSYICGIIALQRKSIFV
jgi:hypothetical protein